MMDKLTKEQLTIPIYFTSPQVFTQEDNQSFTRCKLMMFIVGRTGDKRRFTQEFADRIISTLPNIPVIGCYDEEKGDFKAHDEDIQVYGIVPENNNFHYKTIKGQKWAVTDVILYTNLRNGIGERAAEIVGKPHSLELNSELVKYTIKKDSDWRIDEIVFHDGELEALCVLGEDVQPAFGGSKFFTQEEFDLYFTKEGEDTVEELINFMKLSMSEKEEKIAMALMQAEKGWPVQIFDDSVIYRGRENFIRVSYSLVEDEIVFGETEEIVYPRFLTKEEAEQNNFAATSEETEVVEEVEITETTETVEEQVEEVIEEQATEEVVEEVVEVTTEEVEPSQEDNFSEDIEEQNGEEEQGEVDNIEAATVEEQQEEPATDNSAETVLQYTQSALSEAERAELNGYRREKKIQLIESYEGMISSKKLEDFAARVDDFVIADLEKELALVFSTEYKTKAKTNYVSGNSSPMIMGRVAVKEKSYDEQNITDYERAVKKYLK